jgi:polysaccharide biosynthesis/export protein
MRHATAVILTVFIMAAIAVPAFADDYRLAANDVIEINIWQEPDLSHKQVQINSEGNITVPYLTNVIHAAGLTQGELAKNIHDDYTNAEILIDPKVDINIISRHKLTVWVLGQVFRPGAVEFKQGDTVTSAISQAGSTTDSARLEVSTLTHKTSDKQITLDLRKVLKEGDLTQNYELQEDDVIYVPEDTYNKYYVLGEVQRPGVYQLKDNVTVLSALMQAGGETPQGSIKRTKLVRGDLKNPDQRIIDIGKIKKGDLSADVKLQAGDVVIVPPNGKLDLNRIGAVISTILNVSYLHRVGL